VLVSFTAVSCPLSSLDAAPPPQESPPFYPVPVTPEAGQQTAIPVSFYLSDDYEPAETDTGKTAFALNGDKTLEKFLATSEEREDGAVVRFLDGESGTFVAVRFIGGGPFPASFTLDAEDDSTVSGVFSAYHEDTETFDLTLRYGTETYGPFEGFTLNKNVFGLYQDDENLSPGQNARVRNYITALSVWTSMTYWFNKKMAEMEAGNEYASALYGSLPAGARYYFAGGVKDFVEDVGRGFMKAIENICEVGLAIATAAYGAFKITAGLIVEVAAEIGIAVAAPVVVAVAVVAAIAVTEEAKKEQPGKPAAPSLPPEKLKAPRFEIYYLDEAGIQQPLPVMREGQAPELGEEFYIRPHDEAYTYTSNVKFYFKVVSVEPIDGVVKTSHVFSPVSTLYHPVNILAEAEGNYFEVKKGNGYGKDKKTTLTMKVFNGTATTDSEHPVYFPYYYVNGEEFTGGERFVINFIDKISLAEESQVRIPQHTVSETPGTYDIAPVRPILDKLSDGVYLPQSSYPGYIM
jgi:hypothetical protein